MSPVPSVSNVRSSGLGCRPFPILRKRPIGRERPKVISASFISLQSNYKDVRTTEWSSSLCRGVIGQYPSIEEVSSGNIYFGKQHGRGGCSPGSLPDFDTGKVNGMFIRSYRSVRAKMDKVWTQLMKPSCCHEPSEWKEGAQSTNRGIAKAYTLHLLHSGSIINVFESPVCRLTSLLIAVSNISALCTARWACMFLIFCQ